MGVACECAVWCGELPAGGFDDVFWFGFFGVGFPGFDGVLFVDFFWVQFPPFVELVVWLWFFGFGYCVAGARGWCHMREGGSVVSARGAVDNVFV